MNTLLQINVCNNALSTGKIASEIGELAISKGWKSYIAYPCGGSYNPSKNIPIPIGNRFSRLIHALEARLFDNQGLGFGSKYATKKFVKQVDAISPSIIHLHIIHGYYLNLPILFDYIKSRKIPVVWTIHSCWDFTGHCAFFDTIGCERWKTECHHCPQFKAYPRSWFRDRSRRNYIKKKMMFNSVPKLILSPVSHWLEELLKESFMKGKMIYPIYNGIDTNVFSPSTNINIFHKKYKLTSQFIALGVASTWEPRKNLKDYVRLSKIIPSNITIVLVGLNKSEQDSLPTNILGLPRTKTPQDLVDIYSAADVVLNLSLEETFGLTTIEGFACGTPGIVYNCTASPELVSEETGFVVEPGDIEGVLKCLQQIKEKGKEDYSFHCRKRVLDFFDKNKNYQQYLQLYHNLINDDISET